MSIPLVTVLMPVYNGERYLREAIDSILSQTFTSFEFLIIDDGSTDRSVEIINSIEDSRIRLVVQEVNQGIIATLNSGIELANGKYIARMDADDVSMPTRLEKQVLYMESHPQVGVVGTWFQLYYARKIVQHPIEHDSIKVKLFQYSSLGHPTVMIRKEVLEMNELRYNEKFLHAEDYELWTRCAEVTTLANIPDVLVSYRDHSEQITNKYYKKKNATVDLIHHNLIQQLGIQPTLEESELHRIVFSENLMERIDLFSLTKWFEKLKLKNDEKRRYNTHLFSQMLAELWYIRLATTDKFNIDLLKLYHNSTLKSFLKKSKWKEAKFYMKCWLAWGSSYRN